MTNKTDFPFKLHYALSSAADEKTPRLSHINHSVCVVEYVCSGGGYLQIDGQLFNPVRDSVYFLHKNSTHTYWHMPEDPWHKIFFVADGELMQEICDLSPNNHVEYRAASLLFRLYAELFERKKASHHYVRRVQDHIRALYMKPLYVEEIADQMNLDRRYLSRLFKEKTGQTIQDFLISVRMEEAQKLLLQGVSVENTAFLCGYGDTCNFSKMFKRKFGESPLVWKKRMLGAQQD